MEIKKKRRHVRLKPRFYGWLIAACVVITSVVFFINYNPNAGVQKKLAEVETVAQSFKSVTEDTVKTGQEKLLSESKKKEEAIKQRLKSGDTKGIKVVFLTFDDGPSEHTNAILDLLKKYDAKATFFPNGREKEVELAAYKRIVQEGHTLGNHTYHHQYGLYNNPPAFYDDVAALDDLEKRATGIPQPSKMFRFPGGSNNSNATCVKGIVERGYNYADWNVSSGDGGSNPQSAAEIANRIISGVHEHDVSTVLCHAEMKSTTHEALPQVLETLKAEGYVFLPMDAGLEIYPRFL
ncbi:MAG: polysaccharide deacetylase family protein [Eubacterium sp.]